jgi:hypothetical protein
MKVSFFHQFKTFKSKKLIGYSGNIQDIKKRKNLSQDVGKHPNSQRCWKNMEFSGNPDIYGPPEDSCPWCAGAGCGHCPPK